jgi:CDP-paratose 2-epimerase
VNKRTILVTGGAGFIGSSICFHLRENYPSLTVLALDNLSRKGAEYNIPRFRKAGIGFIHADIRCREDLRLKGNIDALIECSAEPSVMAGYGNNPESIIAVNLTGALNCFELAREKGADIIFLSSSRVYPYAALNALPYRETATRYEWLGGHGRGIDTDFPLNGSRTLYGATKLAAEQILLEYTTQFPLRGVINRCGVVAGPWQFGKADQGVFTFWLMAHMNKSPLSYIGFGGSGKQVRDVLHVLDLCRLIAVQLEDMDRGNGKIFNAGGGPVNSLSLCETTELCRELTGATIPIGQVRDERPGDVRVYCTDNRAVTETFGWKPEKNASGTLQDIHAWLSSHEYLLEQS